MLDDFRTGWTEEDPDYRDDSPVLACFRDLDLSGLTVTGIAESKALVGGGTTMSRSVSSVFKSQQEAETAYLRVATLNLSACLAERLAGQRVVTGEGEVGILSATPAPLSIGQFGEMSTGHRISLIVESSGFQTDVFIDIVFIQEERSLALLIFGSVFSPFASADREALTETVVQRLVQ